MPDYRFSISLRVKHPEIDPGEISRRLNIEPFRKWKHGDQGVTPKGTLLEGKYKETYWAANMHSEKRISSEVMTIEECIKNLNTRLEQFSMYFSDIVSSGGSVEYFVGWFSADNVGIYLSPGLMKQTSDLCISIGIAAYVGEE